ADERRCQSCSSLEPNRGRKMMRRGNLRAIVNISSISGKRAFSKCWCLLYHQSSAGHVTKVMAVELGIHNITVNSVTPAMVDTDMAKNFIDKMAQTTPSEVGRGCETSMASRSVSNETYIEMKEVVNAVLFLASGENRQISGTDLCVDGGFLIIKENYLLKYKMSFTGKRVLVTGAGRGKEKLEYSVQNFFRVNKISSLPIQESDVKIVKELHCQGAKIYALSKTQENLNSLLEELSTNVIPICVDLGNWEQTEKALENVECVDVLINCAAFAEVESFLELQRSNLICKYLTYYANIYYKSLQLRIYLIVFGRQMNVNVKAALHVSQIVARKMIAEGKSGAIVNISSIAGKRAFQNAGVYSTTKAALDMLTKVMAVELGPHNITVNSVTPAMVDTDLIRTVLFRKCKSCECIDGRVYKRI
ncbi:L-xylulose reductase, partial [Orchesella cincta]